MEDVGVLNIECIVSSDFDPKNLQERASLLRGALEDWEANKTVYS